MEILQEMSDRKLLNQRNKATRGLLLGADNWDAINAMDQELLQRGVIDKTTEQEFNGS